MTETKQFKLGDRVRLVYNNGLPNRFERGLTGTVFRASRGELADYVSVDFDNSDIGKEEALYSSRFERIEDTSTDPFDKYRAMGNVFSYSERNGDPSFSFDEAMANAKKQAKHHSKPVAIIMKIAVAQPKPIAIEVKPIQGV